MSLLFAAALAASSATSPVCSWDAPGRNAFSGDVPAAVDRYADIPPAVRARLKQRMAAYQYDDVAAIRRDSIEGKHRYGDLRDMHFGATQVCRSVTRQKWAADAEERGLVYCESGHCLIVPTVCRNVSRVTRAPDDAGAAPVAGSGGGEGGAPQAAAPTDALEFEAPSAGGARPTQPAPTFAGGATTGSSAAPAPVTLASWPDWGSAPATQGAAPAGSFAGGSLVVAAAGQASIGSSGAPLRRESNGVFIGDSPLAAPPLAPNLTAAVPEPGTVWLFVIGTAVLGLARARSARGANG